MKRKQKNNQKEKFRGFLKNHQGDIYRRQAGSIQEKSIVRTVPWSLESSVVKGSYSSLVNTHTLLLLLEGPSCRATVLPFLWWENWCYFSPSASAQSRGWWAICTDEGKELQKARRAAEEGRISILVQRQNQQPKEEQQQQSPLWGAQFEHTDSH